MGADSRPHNDNYGKGVVMALSQATRAAAASQSSPTVLSQADITNAWWETDPEFHEFLDEMERQDNDRTNWA